MPAAQEVVYLWCIEKSPKPFSALDFEKEITSFFLDPMPSEKHKDYHAMYFEIIEFQKISFKNILRQYGRRLIKILWQ